MFSDGLRNRKPLRWPLPTYKLWLALSTMPSLRADPFSKFRRFANKQTRKRSAFKLAVRRLGTATICDREIWVPRACVCVRVCKPPFPGHSRGYLYCTNSAPSTHLLGLAHCWQQGESDHPLQKSRLQAFPPSPITWLTNLYSTNQLSSVSFSVRQPGAWPNESQCFIFLA